jgi:hypothetical protein
MRVERFLVNLNAFKFDFNMLLSRDSSRIPQMETETLIESLYR